MSKTESRFKSKLGSLKKFQHAASANNAVEKARAFFRSLELKHLGSSSSNDNSSSSARRRSTTTNNNDNDNNTNTNTNINATDINHIHLVSSSKLPLPSSSSSSSIVDNSQNSQSSTMTNNASFNTMNPSMGIATARIIQVINPDYSNPKDMILHQVIHSEQDEQHMKSTYYNFQKNLNQRNIQLPEKYNNERNQGYSIPIEKYRNIQLTYDSRPLSPESSLNSNIIYSSPMNKHNSLSFRLPTMTNGNISNNSMSTSLYNYRPLVCRQMESPSLMSSSLHEQSLDPIIRPLPSSLSSSSSSSSMSTWTQSVRRLNSEYTSTINALQQAKEYLQQNYVDSADTISKYANLVARGINELSKSDHKKSLGVSFCLTASVSKESPPLSTAQISKIPIEQSKISTPNMFCKPRIVRPFELDTLVPSLPPLPKLEPISIVSENIENKTDSIATIIKKFNNLNNSSKSSNIIDHDHNQSNGFSSQINKEKQEISTKSEQSNIPLLTSSNNNSTIFSNSSHNIHFQSSIISNEIKQIPIQSPSPDLISSSSSSSSSISIDSTSSTSTSTSEDNLIYPHKSINKNNQEETTYTVETFYKNTNDNYNIKTNLSPNNQQVVIIRENATEEEFNLAQEKKKQEINENQIISDQHRFTINETKVPPLTTPLLTYLNLTTKQPELEKHENYHTVETPSHITNDFISDGYHDEDDETISDVVTINPHTHSPPSHHLINSSSSTSTASSASTVLLSNNNNNSTNHNNNNNKNNIINTQPISKIVTETSPVTNNNLSKINNKHISHLPKSTTTSTHTNISRLKQPTKTISSSSKLKPPSSTIVKPIKPMIVNSPSSLPTTTTPSSIRKPTGITNQSSTMTNSTVNKTIQQQFQSSSSILTNGKKQQLVNGTIMTESQNPSDSPISTGKNRVRSMVNQLNAAVSSSSRPVIPSTKRTSTVQTSINSRRQMSMEPTSNLTKSTTKTTPNRLLFQRAMTVNDNNSVTPSPPTTPNNNISSTYRRKAPLIRSTSNVKEGLLRWCQVQVADYPNVSVTNLSSSWSDGLAFCALTHRFFPDAFDFNSLSSTNRKENFELAFHTAEERAGVPRLLDVSDMLIMGNTPDYKCIFTYLNSFLAKVKDIHPTSKNVEAH